MNEGVSEFTSPTAAPGAAAAGQCPTEADCVVKIQYVNETGCCKDKV